MPYDERLVLESTLCREEEKDTALGKLLNAWLLTILQVHFTCQYRSRWYPSGESIIVLDGVQSVSLIVYQCIYVQFPRVQQLLDSRLNLIYS